ncbi:uncharacterized protein LOC144603326 [Rhinoraja longicauda]
MGLADAAESNSVQDDSFEYRVLMAYAERTCPGDKLTPPQAGGGRSKPLSGRRRRMMCRGTSGHPETITAHRESSTRHRSHRRRSKWNMLFPRCVRTQSSSENELEGGMSEAIPQAEGPSMDIVVPELECETDPHEVAEMLHDVLSAPVSFKMLHSTSLEVDSPDKQKTIDRIVEFLTAEGDSIDDKIKKDPQFGKLFGDKPSFSFFKKIMDYALQTALPVDAEAEAKDKLKQFAFVVHATTNFAVYANLPMALIMGYGEVYLRENFSNWVKEKGGWDMIMEEQHVD